MCGKRKWQGNSLSLLPRWESWVCLATFGTTLVATNQTPLAPCLLIHHISHQCWLHVESTRSSWWDSFFLVTGLLKLTTFLVSSLESPTTPSANRHWCSVSRWSGNTSHYGHRWERQQRNSVIATYTPQQGSRYQPLIARIDTDPGLFTGFRQTVSLSLSATVRTNR